MAMFLFKGEREGYELTTEVRESDYMIVNSFSHIKEILESNNPVRKWFQNIREIDFVECKKSETPFNYYYFDTNKNEWTETSIKFFPDELIKQINLVLKNEGYEEIKENYTPSIFCVSFDSKFNETVLTKDFIADSYQDVLRMVNEFTSTELFNKMFPNPKITIERIQ